jgi:hypothetical protein
LSLAKKELMQQPMETTMKKLFVLTPIIIAIALVGCGESSSPTNTASTTVQPTTVPTIVSTPQPAHAGKTAAQIVQELKSKGLPIGAVFSYSAENDPNHLLGRPGQYTGKANFRDTSVAIIDQGTGISVSDGGSVEVFATTADARHRLAYLQAISTSGNALFAEYEYLDGVALLRVSSQLTPTQAKAYETAFKAV